MSKDFCTDEGSSKCSITGNPGVIDDCHITIEFGYGSDKDMTTYQFSPVADETGKKILKYISTLMPRHITVAEHARDVLEETFGER
jgi:hypothetical protein